MRERESIEDKSYIYISQCEKKVVIYCGTDKKIQDQYVFCLKRK